MCMVKNAGIKKAATWCSGQKMEDLERLSLGSHLIFATDKLTFHKLLNLAGTQFVFLK